MPRPAFAESLLALFAGRDRAAAIYGDLTEMAAVRGRGWFFAAYIRTLISLTWRTPVALAVGLIAFALGFLSMNNMPNFLGRDSWEVERYFVNVNAHLEAMRAVCFALLPFWFLAAFAAARYGVRDRMARLALAVFTVLVCAWMNLYLNFALAACFGGLALAVIAAAYFSERWRGAAVAVSVMGVVGTVTVVVGSVTVGNLADRVANFAWRHLSANPAHMLLLETATVWLVILAVMAWICTHLHRILMRNDSVSVGGANA